MLLKEQMLAKKSF